MWKLRGEKRLSFKEPPFCEAKLETQVSRVEVVERILGRSEISQWRESEGEEEWHRMVI